MNEIHDLAEKLKRRLAPSCQRIEIAGSLRRGKADPKDIEIVCIPRFEEIVTESMFEGEKSSVVYRTYLLTTAVDDICNQKNGEWEYDPDVKRRGEKYKRLRHKSVRNSAGALVACDLFIVNQRSWGIQMTIRTGPGAYSQRLVTTALHKKMSVDGGLLHGHPREYMTTANGQAPVSCPFGEDCKAIIPTLEERDFFKAIGIEWVEPKDRV